MRAAHALDGVAPGSPVVVAAEDLRRGRRLARRACKLEAQPAHARHQLQAVDLVDLGPLLKVETEAPLVVHRLHAHPALSLYSTDFPTLPVAWRVPDTSDAVNATHGAGASVRCSIHVPAERRTPMLVAHAAVDSRLTEIRRSSGGRNNAGAAYTRSAPRHGCALSE